MLESIYSGNIVYTTSSRELVLEPNGIIAVSSDGFIIHSAKGTPQAFFDSYNGPKPSSLANVKHYTSTSSQFFFPGFIDTHIHAPQHPNLGIYNGNTLLDWLETYTFPLEISYKDTDWATKAYTQVVERCLCNGTTFASYFGTIHVDSTLELARIAKLKGMRALVGRVCMERLAPELLLDKTSAHALESDGEFISKLKALDPEYELVKPILTPRFAPSCTMDTLKNLGSLAKEEKLPVQTHLSENEEEIELVARLFPECENYTNVYDRAGLLKSDTILAHCVHLTQPEIETIAARQAGISHCPVSNMSVGSGLAPIQKFLRSDIHVGLGSDISGGSSISVLENARQAILVSRVVAQQCKDPRERLSVADALYLATLGGAHLVGAAKTLGSFQVGKKWDAQLIDLAATAIPLCEPRMLNSMNPRQYLEMLVNKWVFSGDDRHTLQVWVNGVSVVDKQT